MGSSEEVFAAAVAASDDHKRGKGPPLKFYASHRQLALDVHDHLPRSEDRTLDAYDGRMARQLGGEDFLLHFTGVQQYAPDVWFRVRAELSALFALVGLPSLGLEFELFLGRYGRTSGGIHREGCPNIHFMVHGRKQMRLWPPSDHADRMAMNVYGDEHFLDDVGAEQALGSPLILEAAAGEAFYWPAGFWHVGESPDITLSVNAALYFGGRPIDVLRRAVERVFADLPHEVVESLPFNPDGGVDPPMAVVVGAASDAAEHLWSGLSQHVAREWLAFLTGMALSPPPPPRPAPRLRFDDTVHCVPSGEVHWAPTDDGSVIYAAGGSTASTPAAPWLATLFETLSRGSSARVGDLVALGAPEDATRIRSILETLVSFRALDVNSD